MVNGSNRPYHCLSYIRCEFKSAIKRWFVELRKIHKNNSLMRIAGMR